MNNRKTVSLSSFGLVVWITFLILKLFVPAFAGEKISPEHHHPCGLDISWHSGEVNWQEIKKQGFHFVIVKATEGQDLKDKRFDINWPALKEHGILRGAYHYYITTDEPGEQAQFLFDTVKLEPGDLAPIVDIEEVHRNTDQAEMYPKLLLYLKLLEHHYGIKPIIYTSPRFWNKHFHLHLKGYPLWIAEYGVPDPSIPDGWKTWHLWQYEEDAQVNGIEKGVDLSRLNHSSTTLADVTIPEHAIAPGVLQPGDNRDEN